MKQLFVHMNGLLQDLLSLIFSLLKGGAATIGGFTASAILHKLVRIVKKKHKQKVNSAIQTKLKQDERNQQQGDDQEE